MDKSDAGKKGYQKTKHLLEAYRNQKQQTAISDYESNPKYCANCNKKLPYNKRHNKFCNQSCSATFNNRGVLRVKSSKPKHCDYCGNIKETRQNKYCDACIAENVYTNKKTKLANAQSDRVRKRIIIDERGHQCESCGLSKWLEHDIPIELDHIDGNPDNNAKDNLRLVCPNCHALTETYKGANRGGESSRQKTRRRRYKQGKTY